MLKRGMILKNMVKLSMVGMFNNNNNNNKKKYNMMEIFNNEFLMIFLVVFFAIYSMMQPNSRL